MFEGAHQLQQYARSEVHGADTDTEQFNALLPPSLLPAPPARLLSRRIPGLQQSQQLPREQLLHSVSGGTMNSAALGLDQRYAGPTQTEQSRAQAQGPQAPELQLPAIPRWNPAAVSIPDQGPKERDFVDKQQALQEVNVNGMVLSDSSKPSRFTFKLLHCSLAC